MDIIKAFQNNNVGVNITIQGTHVEPLFRASDIGLVLGFSDINNTIKSFNQSEKVRRSTPTLGGDQAVNFLTEKGLYKLLFKSRKEVAIQFQDWVCDIIKEIRLNGKYELEKQLELKDKEIHNTMLNAYDTKPIVYLGTVENNILKYGSTNKLKERYQTHKREISKEFNLVYVIETKYNRELENFIRKELKDRIISKEYNNKNQTELIQLNDSFTLQKLINQIIGFEKILSDKTELVNLVKENSYLKDRLSKYETVENSDNIPSFEQLKTDHEKMKDLVKVGDKYSVSDTTIKNWFNYYDNNYVLPDHTKNKCLDCDKELKWKESSRCVNCSNIEINNKNRKVQERPSLEQIIEDYKELKSMVKVGEKYGVSDNAVKKWIKSYDNTFDIKDHKLKTINKCIDCGTKIKPKSTRCAPCHMKTY